METVNDIGSGIVAPSGQKQKKSRWKIALDREFENRVPSKTTLIRAERARLVATLPQSSNVCGLFETPIRLRHTLLCGHSRKKRRKKKKKNAPASLEYSLRFFGVNIFIPPVGASSCNSFGETCYSPRLHNFYFSFTLHFGAIVALPVCPRPIPIQRSVFCYVEEKRCRNVPEIFRCKYFHSRDGLPFSLAIVSVNFPRLHNIYFCLALCAIIVSPSLFSVLFNWI